MSMKTRITKEEAEAFKMRWEAVNAFQLEELRRTPPHLKVLQLSTLMTWVKDFKWEKALKMDESVVRKRWERLKRIYGG